MRDSHKNPILQHKYRFAKHNLLSRGQEVQFNVVEQEKNPPWKDLIPA